MALFGALSAASCGDEITSASSGSSSSGGGGDNGACTSDADCKTGFNMICAETDDGQCGPIARKCIQYPASCSEGTLYTACGCDGKSHAVSPCPSATLSAQIDTRPDGCPAQAGKFWCGDGSCNVGAQYCVEGVSSIDCVDLPQSCMGASATCACLMDAGMTACGCVDEAGGGIRVNGCGL